MEQTGEWDFTLCGKTCLIILFLALEIETMGYAQAFIKRMSAV